MYIVLDTETTKRGEVYDLSYIICNSKGKVLKKRSFLINDIFENNLNDEFTKSKVSIYREKIKNKKIIPCNIHQAKIVFNMDCEDYSINKIFAYNINFDKRVLNKAIENFFPSKVKFYDLWTTACYTILTSKKYLNFCLQYGFLSEKGNVKTSAETVYRYLTDNIHFIEEHTGFEDAVIENEILKIIKKRHLKIYTQKGNCWKNVNK